MRVDLTDLIDALADLVAERLAEKLAAEEGEARAATPPDSPDRLLTVAEAAEYLRAKPQRIYDLIGQGRLEVERDGNRVLIRKAVIDRHLMNGGTGGRSG